MNEFIEKLIERLEEKAIEHRETGFEMERKGFSNIADKQYAKQTTYLNAIDIVNQLAEEYNGGWITDRNPTIEECGEYGHAEFQVTIPQSKGNKTLTMDFVYETVRGKEVARWKWCGRLPIWKVLAWKPLDAPYQPKGE